jgi:glycine oxidase
VRRPDVVVVGGGVVGCASAWFLAKEGLRVRLFERDALAAHASGAAAGMLAPLCEASGPGIFLRLGLRSLGLFPELVRELRERSGVDPEYERSGVLRVAADAGEARRLAERARDLAAEGLEWLDARAAREAHPGLAQAEHGALHSSREGHVRSPLLVQALALAAEGRGARVEVGVPVLALELEGGRVTGVRTPAGSVAAGAVVLCAGSSTQACLVPLGAQRLAPVEPVRGQGLILAPVRPLPPTIVWRGPLYLVPKRDGSVVVGATEERVGFDSRATAGGVRQLLDGALALLPELARASFEAPFVGLRPATPDGLPLVGPVPGFEGLWIAAGHFRNGVLLAPVTGALLAAQLLGRPVDAEAAALRPDRFA